MRTPHKIHMSSAGETTRRSERRAEILATARAMFGDHDYEQTTMADIAARIGIAEGTLYLYFDSKTSLVLGVAADWFGEIVEATEREAAVIGNSMDRMRFLIHRHLEVILTHREMYQIFLREGRAGHGYGSSPLRAINRRYTGLMLTLFEGLIVEGRIAGGLDPRTMRDLVYGGTEHVAWTATLGGAVAFDTGQKADEIALTYARAFGMAPTTPDDIERRLRRLEFKLRLD